MSQIIAYITVCGITLMVGSHFVDRSREKRLESTGNNGDNPLAHRSERSKVIRLRASKVRQTADESLRMCNGGIKPTG